MRQIVFIFSLIALLVPPSVAGAPRAQSLSDIPSPAECGSHPRSLESLELLLSASESDSDAGAESEGQTDSGFPQIVLNTEPPSVLESQPADEATVSAVQATLRELTACQNAGRLLDAAGLFSDQFFIGMAATGEGVSTDEVLVSFQSSSTPPEEDWLAAPTVLPEFVRVMADGRVAVVLFLSVVDYPSDPPSQEPAVILVREGDRWLIDEITLTDYRQIPT